MATSVATLIFDAETNRLLDAITRLDGVEKSAKRADVATTNFGKNMRLTKGPTSALSSTSGQLAVQFQDVAVQAQMGTDAVRIFGQQAPQILSVFGPTGAVLGAVAAIGAAVGGSLVAAFRDAGDESKKFSDVVKLVGKSVNDLTDGTFGLSEELRKLAQQSEAAARLQLAVALDNAEVVARKAAKSIKELGIEGEGMYRSIDGVSSGIQRLLLNFDSIVRQGMGPESTFKQVRDGAEAAGLSVDTARGLFEDYLAAIDPNAKGADLVAFAENLAGIAIKMDDPALRTFAQTLLEQALEAQNTEEKATLLRKAIEDLATATNGADQKTVDFIDRLKTMASEAGKTREQILAMQVAQLTDPEAFKEAQELLDIIQFEADVRDEAARAQKAADEARREAEKKAREEAKATADARKKFIDEESLLIDLDIEAKKRREKADEDAAKKAKEAEELRQRVLALGVRKTILLKQQETREKERIERENAQRLKQFEDEERQRRAMLTDALLGLEDKLMKGKSEKQKAGFRTLVNVMNEEKRAKAMMIVVDSYSAAMKAWGALAGIPFIGPALGAAAAGTILAAGVSFAAQSLAGRALGGQVRSGESYVVGERGPEVLTMGTNGRIIPNDKLNGSMQGPKTTNVNVSFNIQANDTTGFDQLLQSRRGQIIGIINQAMNDQGRRAIV